MNKNQTNQVTPPSSREQILKDRIAKQKEILSHIKYMKKDIKTWEHEAQLLQIDIDFLKPRGVC